MISSCEDPTTLYHIQSAEPPPFLLAELIIMEREAPPNAGSSRRLEVLHGHLKPPPAYSCSSGKGGSSRGVSKAEASKKKTSSSAPMSSSKDEVQKAFPRAR